jgi:hypothetical protein
VIEPSGWLAFAAPAILLPSTDHFQRGRNVESTSPLGTLWAGLGFGAFYVALVWLNLLLGHFLTPLFLIPLTWLQDAVQRKKKRA